MIGPGLTKISPKALRQSPATLQVDVIADLACPWCYLGKQLLDEALLAVHGPSVVTWHPFQVNPSLPAEGWTLASEVTASAYRDAGAAGFPTARYYTVVPVDGLGNEAPR